MSCRSELERKFNHGPDAVNRGVVGLVKFVIHLQCQIIIKLCEDSCACILQALHHPFLPPFACILLVHLTVNQDHASAAPPRFQEMLACFVDHVLP